MGNKHRVKTHRWERGVLQTLEHWFDSLEDAQLFSDNIDAHAVKVYNLEGDIVDSRTLGKVDAVVNKLPSTEDTSYSYPAVDSGYSYPVEDNGYSYPSSTNS
jgi:hypothetical protein